jgi:hypothetical protein
MEEEGGGEQIVAEMAIYILLSGGDEVLAMGHGLECT